MSDTLGTLGALGEGGGYGFGGPNDPYLQQLLRRQALAAALAKQGGQQAQQPMTHWTQVLGSIAQQGVGAWQQDKLEKRYLDYSAAQQQRERAMLADILRGVNGGGASPPAPAAAPLPPAQTEGGAAPATAPAKGGPPIAATTLAPEAKALLTGIYGAESPDYNVRYGGSRFDSFADHPRTPVPIMSGPLKGQYSTAAGRPQFLASTWDEVKRKYSLPDFSPQSQDLGAWYLARDTYQKGTGRDLAADLKSSDPEVRQGITTALRGVWPSLPGGSQPNGASNGFWQRFDQAMAPPPAAAASMPPPAPNAVQPPPGAPVAAPAAAPAPGGGPMPRDRQIMLAQALMFSGNPNLAKYGAMALNVAKALPETDRELVQVRQADGSMRFVPRSQAAGMISAPEPQRPMSVSPGADLVDPTTGKPIYRNTNDPATTRVQMTNDMRGQTSFDVERGKQLAANVDEWNAARRKAGEQMMQLASFERANKAFTTGAAAGTRLAIGKWAQMAGIPEGVLGGLGLDKNALASGEEMRGITARMMVDMIGKGGFPANNFSNADREALERALVSVDNTPEGNARLIAMGRAMTQRNIEIGEEWSKWRRANGTTPQSVERFQEERLPQIIERNIIAPVKVASPDEAMKLPPGTRFIAPDGVERMVPGAPQ